VSRDGYFFEGLNLLVCTFCVCADDFQCLSNAFHYTIINLFLVHGFRYYFTESQATSCKNFQCQNRALWSLKRVTELVSNLFKKKQSKTLSLIFFIQVRNKNCKNYHRMNRKYIFIIISLHHYLKIVLNQLYLDVLTTSFLFLVVTLDSGVKVSLMH
jgi:hypothetical protein